MQQVSAPELVNQVDCYWSEQAQFNVGRAQRSPPPANGSSVRVCLTGSSTLQPVTSKPTVRILLRIQQAGSEGYSQDVPELLDYARERVAAFGTLEG